jgi:hypothetical protein
VRRIINCKKKEEVNLLSKISKKIFTTKIKLRKKALQIVFTFIESIRFPPVHAVFSKFWRKSKSIFLQTLAIMAHWGTHAKYICFVLVRVYVCFR